MGDFAVEESVDAINNATGGDPLVDATLTGLGGIAVDTSIEAIKSATGTEGNSYVEAQLDDVASMVDDALEEEESHLNLSEKLMAIAD